MDLGVRFSLGLMQAKTLWILLRPQTVAVSILSSQSRKKAIPRATISITVVPPVLPLLVVRIPDAH